MRHPLNVRTVTSIGPPSSLDETRGADEDVGDREAVEDVVGEILPLTMRYQRIVDGGVVDEAVGLSLIGLADIRIFPFAVLSLYFLF